MFKGVVRDAIWIDRIHCLNSPVETFVVMVRGLEARGEAVV